MGDRGDSVVLVALRFLDAAGRGAGANSFFAELRRRAAEGALRLCAVCAGEGSFWRTKGHRFAFLPISEARCNARNAYVEGTQTYGALQKGTRNATIAWCVAAAQCNPGDRLQRGADGVDVPDDF